jgi:hypothetical protein
MQEFRYFCAGGHKKPSGYIHTYCVLTEYFTLQIQKN